MNRGCLYYLHTVFGQCLSSPNIKLVINKRQKNAMKWCQINFIEEVKNFFILHKAEQLMIKPSDIIIHISPQPVYILIVSTFATYHTSTLWSSICKHKICNQYIFFPLIWLHLTRNTLALHAFHKTTQQNFKIAVPNMLQRNWKSAKTINYSRYNHAPPHQFMIDVNMP